MNLMSVPALAWAVDKHIDDERQRDTVQLLWLIPAYLSNVAQWVCCVLAAIIHMLRDPLELSRWIYLVPYMIGDVGINTVILGGDPRTSISLRSHRMRDKSNLWKFVIRLTEHIDHDHGKTLADLPFGYGTEDDRRLLSAGVVILVQFWAFVAWQFL